NTRRTGVANPLTRAATISTQPARVNHLRHLRRRDCQTPVVDSATKEKSMKLFLIPGLAVAMQITAFAQTNSKCSDIAKFKSPGTTLEITRAAALPAGPAAGARGRGGNSP